MLVSPRPSGAGSSCTRDALSSCPTFVATAGGGEDQHRGLAARQRPREQLQLAVDRCRQARAQALHGVARPGSQHDVEGVSVGPRDLPVEQRLERGQELLVAQQHQPLVLELREGQRDALGLAARATGQRGAARQVESSTAGALPGAARVAFRLRRAASSSSRMRRSRRGSPSGGNGCVPGIAGRTTCTTSRSCSRRSVASRSDRGPAILTRVMRMIMAPRPPGSPSTISTARLRQRLEGLAGDAGQRARRASRSAPMSRSAAAWRSRSAPSSVRATVSKSAPRSWAARRADSRAASTRARAAASASFTRASSPRSTSRRRARLSSVRGASTRSAMAETRKDPRKRRAPLQHSGMARL